MGLFSRRKGPVGDRKSVRHDLAQLGEWVKARRGVEAYVEPQTSMTQTTLLLVANDGEWTRLRIESPKVATDFARSHGIPVYDTNRVGTPQRMRDYNLRQKQKATASSSGPASAPEPARWSPAQEAAIMVLERAAGISPLPDNASEEDLLRVLRSARAKTHPDRHQGDRTAWDRVETARQTLNLPS